MRVRRVYNGAAWLTRAFIYYNIRGLRIRGSLSARARRPRCRQGVPVAASTLQTCIFSFFPFTLSAPVQLSFYHSLARSPSTLRFRFLSVCVRSLARVVSPRTQGRKPRENSGDFKTGVAFVVLLRIYIYMYA